jgi:hypothetical protein
LASLHDVKTMSDSIPVTWNFVHRQRLAAFCEYLDGQVSEADLEVLGFFLEPELRELSPGGLRRALQGLPQTGAAAGPPSVTSPIITST